MGEINISFDTSFLPTVDLQYISGTYASRPACRLSLRKGAAEFKNDLALAPGQVAGVEDNPGY